MTVPDPDSVVDVTPPVGIKWDDEFIRKARSEP